VFVLILVNDYFRAEIKTETYKKNKEEDQNDRDEMED
jgi:hypothetical protein